MYDEAYVEETRLVGTEEYKNIIGRKSGKSFYLWKIYFNKDINYLRTSDEKQQNFDCYSLKIKNVSDSRFQLERQSYREGTDYSTYTYVDKAQCEKLLGGDTAWMKDCDDALLKELYIQMTVNKIEPGVIVCYEREIYRMHGSGDMIIFDKSIRSSYDFEAASALHGDAVMQERLQKDCVVMTYHKPVLVPRVIASILNFNDGRKIIMES